MTTTRSRQGEAGFSLVELMVAMVITLIVTGAIFGLLGSGQSAFKVQPERTDRQQNIRTAMDLILRDASSAGVGMGRWVQVFTPLLDGVGPVSPFGPNTDELEIVTNTVGFPNEEVCAGAAPADSVILKKQAIDFGAGTRLMVLFRDGGWNVRNATTFTTATGDPPCTGGDHIGMRLDGVACAHGALGNAGDGGLDPVSCGLPLGSGAPCCTIDSVGFGEVVRYRIANGADGLPNLERSVNGGVFQVVARGIEDLQVVYVQQDLTTSGVGAAPPGAPLVVVDDYAKLITEVRVTLSARAVTANIQGATYAVGGLNAALRGSLTAQVTPRQALATLTVETGVPKWN
jgi:prepilin-type N-terminal cleavage/methylation domain-containing protein